MCALTCHWCPSNIKPRVATYEEIVPCHNHAGKKTMIQSLLSDKFEKICIILVLQLCCGASHSAENTHHLTWVSIECKSEYKKKLRIYSNVLLIEKMPTQPGHNHLKKVFQPVWAKHLFRFSATTILQWFCVHLANSGCNTLVLVRFGKTTSSKKRN